MNKVSFKNAFFIFIILFTFNAISQEIPTIKHLDKTTISIVELDYDNDGDLDCIAVGVMSDRDQGRIYIVENKGTKYGKPEYIYSFPTIPIKQILNVTQKDDIITIHSIGTSPKGIESKYVATLNKGKFQGMLTTPVSANSQQY